MENKTDALVTPKARCFYYNFIANRTSQNLLLRY